MSAPAGGGVGVVMAGEGDRLDGEEGACEEGDGDDGGEGSGVLRLTVSRLGSAGVGFAGFGSSFTSGLLLPLEVWRSKRLEIGLGRRQVVA